MTTSFVGFVYSLLTLCLAIKGSACDVDAYCRSKAGALSYCKTWLDVPCCAGGDQFKDCATCGQAPRSQSSTSTSMPSTPTTPTKSSSSSTDTKTSFSPFGTKATSDCEALPTYRAPLFIWVEMANLNTLSDFVTFFQRLRTFVLSNCVNAKVTTLVIRIVSPSYPQTNPMFWPPWTSPLYTEFVRKLRISSSGKVKILLYPYVMEDLSRSAWVKFANITGTKPVVNATSGPTVYDGIFKFIDGWQKFINPNSSSVLIDGFMLDLEELRGNVGKFNLINFTSPAISQYKAAYPNVKVACSLGYDEGKSIAAFSDFVDYLHLQVYDLYYPVVSAGRSRNTSVFEIYQENGAGLLSVLLSKVFTPSILNAYKGRESKIKLMWSTQALGLSDCIYPLDNDSCGPNYEFDWSPAGFNQFIQLAQASPQLSMFEHGVYTFNFIRQDWLIKSSRSR
jgi:hypothetical protein